MYSPNGKIVQRLVQKTQQKRRGKKDFAIQIFCNSRPGKDNIPNGIYGPHTIGAFSHLQSLRDQYKLIGYNSHMNNYGYGGYNQTTSVNTYDYCLSYKYIFTIDTLHKFAWRIVQIKASELPHLLTRVRYVPSFLGGVFRMTLYI